MSAWAFHVFPLLHTASTRRQMVAQASVRAPLVCFFRYHAVYCPSFDQRGGKLRRRLRFLAIIGLIWNDA